MEDNTQVLIDAVSFLRHTGHVALQDSRCRDTGIADSPVHEKPVFIVSSR
jgi:hypothetical protein